MKTKELFKNIPGNTSHGCTAEEYEKKMAPLREALEKEVVKTDVSPYRGLTIRRFASLWEAASGGRTLPLEQIAYEYDLDSAADFFKFNQSLPGDHMVDLDDAVIRFSPKLINHDAPDEDKLWVLELFSDGEPTLTAVYVQRLQQAAVHFYLRPAKDVLKAFNKELGYRKRSLRLAQKRKG